jgi:hypothetical protein
VANRDTSSSLHVSVLSRQTTETSASIPKLFARHQKEILLLASLEVGGGGSCEAIDAVDTSSAVRGQRATGSVGEVAVVCDLSAYLLYVR